LEVEKKCRRRREEVEEEMVEEEMVEEEVAVV
jgi:hypothetical protein